MIYKCNIPLEDSEEFVYLYVDYDDDYNLEFTYNKKFYTEIDNLHIEYYLDKNYEDIKQDIIKIVQTIKKR